jgi:hypothetical protein
MRTLHHPPRLQVQIRSDWTILMIALLLLMVALWLLSLISPDPRERAVPQPTIAKETPHHFFY